MRTFTADKGDAGRRVDLVTRRHLADLPRANRTRIQHWIAEARVRINGAVVDRPAARVAEFDSVSVDVPEHWQRGAPQPEPGGVDCLYDDADFMVVNKPAGMVSHPTFKHLSGSLLNRLLWCAESWPREQRPSLVGRLDKQTSGLVVVAKSTASHARLQRVLNEPRSEKQYLALVQGRVDEQHGRIRLRLRRDPRDRRRVIADPNTGVESLTLFERLTASAASGSALTLLQCRLMTGRMHQIRVHLSARGWPIVGDRKYGADQRTGVAAIDQFPRQALHAWRVVFPHPVDGRTIDVTAPIPSDLRELLAACQLDFAEASADAPGHDAIRETSPPRQTP